MVLDRLPALPLGRFLDRQAGRAARVRFGQAPARLLAPGGRRVMSAWPAVKNMSRKWLDLSASGHDGQLIEALLFLPEYAVIAAA